MNPNSVRDNISGAIIAGGKSSRMGSPKPLLQYESASFIRTIALVLQSVFARVIVIADDATLGEEAGLPVYPDIYKESGPLAGIHSALTHADAEALFVCPADIPQITASEIRVLLAAAKPGRITIAAEGERWHPLFGLYPASVLSELNATLQRGDLRIQEFIRQSAAGYDICHFEAGSVAFRNINTPEEYRRLTGE